MSGNISFSLPEVNIGESFALIGRHLSVSKANRCSPNGSAFGNMRKPRLENIEKSLMRTSLIRSKSLRTRIGEDPSNIPNIGSFLYLLYKNLNLSFIDIFLRNTSIKLNEISFKIQFNKTIEILVQFFYRLRLRKKIRRFLLRSFKTRSISSIK